MTILAAIKKVVEVPQARGLPLVRRMEGYDYLEIRVLGLSYRVFFIRRPGLMVILDGTKKKSQKLSPKYLRKIQTYAVDYLERCLKNEDEYDERLFD